MSGAKATFKGESVISNFQDIAPVPVETTIVPDTPITTTPEVSNTSVSPNGTIEPSPSTIIEPIVTPETPSTNGVHHEPQKDDEVSFHIAFEDEPSTPTTTPTTQPTTSWKDIIKNIDKKELYQELGLNDFAIEINEHLNRGGHAEDYLAAKAIDWNKVPDMDIVKSEFKSKHPNLEADDLNYLFNKKYGENEVDDDDVKREKALNLKVDAYDLRQKKIAEQSNFKIPENKTNQEANTEYVQLKEQIAANQKNAEAARQYITNHPSVQNLINSKRVTIDLGNGVRPFNYLIDKPEFLVRALVDGSFYSKLITNEKGELNVDKMLRIAKYAFDMDAHDKDIFNYGKNYGHRKELEEGQNAQKPNGIPVAPEKADLRKTFQTSAKQGRIGDHVKSLR